MIISTPSGASEPLAVRPEQAAAMLSLHRSRIFPLIMSGRIKSFRVGKSRRIPVESIRAFMAEQLAAAEAERSA